MRASPLDSSYGRLQLLELALDLLKLLGQGERPDQQDHQYQNQQNGFHGDLLTRSADRPSAPSGPVRTASRRAGPACPCPIAATRPPDTNSRASAPTGAVNRWHSAAAITPPAIHRAAHRALPGVLRAVHPERPR